VILSRKWYKTEAQLQWKKIQEIDTSRYSGDSKPNELLAHWGTSRPTWERCHIGLDHEHLSHLLVIRPNDNLYSPEYRSQTLIFDSNFIAW